MLLKNNSVAWERFWELREQKGSRQFSRIVKFSTCLECKEVIFNPLCPFCLANQIEAWLASYPSEIRDKIISNIRNYLLKTKNMAGKSTKCIVCKKARTALCPYCFTEQVFSLLKRIKVHNIVLKEFLQFFNYDFEHTGYSKEAEKLGIF